MVLQVKTDFIAVGCNRHPAAADWDSASGYVAYGAQRNVALWDALNSDCPSIRALLSGHTDVVNVVKFFNCALSKKLFILSGSADKTIRVWNVDESSPELSTTVYVVSDSEASINAIALETTSGLFVSGSADNKVRVWKIECEQDGIVRVSLLQTISIVPRFFPLALALSPLFNTSSFILAVGGTRSITQVYVTDLSGGSLEFQLQATLSGHEGWIRSLAFVPERHGDDSDLLLASASQDKYIRIWRVHRGQTLPPAIPPNADPALGTLGKSLSNKAHRIQAAGIDCAVTFEALLLGHEDWIYTVSWSRSDDRIQLLSASADSSLAIWEADKRSGVWVCLTRLGEISGQKGATTATGSTGGYWIGLWSPSGEAVISLGRTGGWRMWKYDRDQSRWLQSIAVSGHVKDVTGIAWARDGGYLLSTSSDQTTRLFAEWKREEISSWHELSRPQIHGYGLNCIDSLNRFRFVSGADEKLLRVFEQPKSIAELLGRLSGIQDSGRDTRPEAASIPVLGLSNKAVEVRGDELSGTALVDDHNEASEPSPSNHDAGLSLSHPPIEDQLARHTLWPESEKLYGHGYEISTLAISHDQTLIATACRASSIDHAVIRLYETKEWREVEPALKAHSLTVTRLCFSADDQHLLSVGRDRQWAIFQRTDGEPHNHYQLISSNPKGHSRMILDCAWAPLSAGRIFVTASRDKSAKIWQISHTKETSTDITGKCITTLTAGCPITAVDVIPHMNHDKIYLLTGLEDGSIKLYILLRDPKSNESLEIIASLAFDSRITPSKAITQLSWRPPPRHRFDDVDNDDDDEDYNGKDTWQVAVASEDSSVRIYVVNLSLEDY